MISLQGRGGGLSHKPMLSDKEGRGYDEWLDVFKVTSLLVFFLTFY